MDYVHISSPAPGGRDQWYTFSYCLLAISGCGNRSSEKILERLKKNQWKKLKIFDRKSILKIFFENFSKFLKNQDFENFRFSTKNIFDQISKSIFDQKFSIFFHDLFFKPLKNHQENAAVKARNPENATRTRETSKRG